MSDLTQLPQAIAKQESWIKANRKPLIIGAVLMLALVLFVLGIVHLL
jgi:F0F1-type ATP synthase membrane subunit c/vacuolar-type H+-ATPase subunit K